MMNLLAWLAGSRLGRWLASSLIALIGYVATSFYRRGLKADQARQTTEALKRLKERIRTNEDIRRMSTDERRKRLSDDWVS
ncbi:hypothetical protein SAMN04515647_3794 [Cohaesibacter sp. ES.047]|uniref:hypothetical protein n=1 Tax=Cohaesibacter sp. ES.047 TaxID=1798205 RepID=UPI000BB739E5|nr:hypothetical protein [Cohaesibacter sp. ES.047]SNY93497.1 hypothetical protein SAMN04515647_3794 [Cohaesibacter sp. ES.047]